MILDLDNLTLSQNLKFNSIAQNVRHDYNQLIEKISEPYIDNLNWIVSVIASRNKYNSQLYYRCCQLKFIEEQLNYNAITVIKTTDRPLSKLLKKYFTNCKIECTESSFGLFWRQFRPIRQFLIAVTLLFLRFFSRKKPEIIDPQSKITIVDTFVLNNEPGDEGGIFNGVYRDRYYTGMLDYLNEEESRNIFFLPTIIGFINPYFIFKKIRSANYNFILHDDYLKFSDYISILKHPFQVLKIHFKGTYFERYDISLLLNDENWRSCSDFISLLGVLNYRFIKRLSEHNINVVTFIEWYENQVIDRGMILGIHKYFPKTKVIGYQGYIISKTLHFYTQPNQSEFKSNVVPDVIAVTGKGLIPSMYEFCDKVVVESSPGFRFTNVWRERKFNPIDNLFTILIGLPIELSDSKLILERVMQNTSLMSNKLIKIYVKPHPTHKPESIKKLFPNNDLTQFDFVVGSFHDYLEKSNLVISNASSVTLESIAKGVPVLLIGPSTGILQSPIPEDVDKQIWDVCYDDEEFNTKIERFYHSFSTGNVNYKEIGNYIRDSYFEPVSREGVLKFLRIN